MSLNKDDLIVSNRALQKGEKVVLLGKDIVIPVDNTELSFSFSQLVGYDENNQPVLQQLTFNGNLPVLTKKQIQSDIVDIQSVVLSMQITEANDDFPIQAIGIYTITNTVSTSWNNYIWKNENNYQIIKQNNNWIVEKDGVTYATNNTNNPLSNNWDKINIQQIKNKSQQHISFFRCVNFLDNYTKWTGMQCRFNKRTNQFVSINKLKVFDVIDGFIPIQDSYYVVLDYSYIITQCNGYYYEYEDVSNNDIISSSSSSSSQSSY